MIKEKKYPITKKFISHITSEIFAEVERIEPTSAYHQYFILDEIRDRIINEMMEHKVGIRKGAKKENDRAK